MIFYKKKSWFTINRISWCIFFPSLQTTPPKLFQGRAQVQLFQLSLAFLLFWIRTRGYFNVQCSSSGIWKILYFLTLELNTEIRASLHGVIFYFCMQGAFPDIVLIVQNLFLQEGYTGIALTDVRRFILLRQHQSWVNKETKPNFTSGQPVFVALRARNTCSKPFQWGNISRGSHTNSLKARLGDP